jgi:PmbA protein
MPVLFDSYAFVDMLGLLEDILSADMVYKGMSCMAGKISHVVAPEQVTVVDDPGLEGGCGNSSFDDEGVPRKRIKLIDRGILSGYFHTAETARKMGKGRPGNACRTSFKSTPEPGGTNFYLQPGEITAADILAGMGEGILIQNIMGIHTADPISGDFSLGFNGYYINSGSREHPLCEMTVAGSVPDLLAGIESVGDDLKFIGGTGSPSVLVTGLSVSGE